MSQTEIRPEEDRRTSNVYPHPGRRAEDAEATPKRRKRRSATSRSETDETKTKKPRAAGRKHRAKKLEPAPQRLFLRGTNLQPPGHKLIPCLAGSKQSILVDLLGRKEGASMEELLEGLAGGRRSWTEPTVRSAFGWDLKLKGYGVRSSFDEDGTERFHLVKPKGQRVPKHSPVRVSNKHYH